MCISHVIHNTNTKHWNRDAREEEEKEIDVAFIDGANERFDQFSKRETSFFLPF
jgi:hypothetical protein